MKEIIIREIIGCKYGAEDAILIKREVKENLKEGVMLNFDGIRATCSFLSTIFTDLILTFGRDYIISKVNIKNLSNDKAFKRVVIGTAF